MKTQKENKDKNPMRKQKDLKVLESFVYISITYEDKLHIQVLDKKTGKVYAGNINKTFNNLYEWKNRYKEESK